MQYNVAKQCNAMQYRYHIQYNITQTNTHIHINRMTMQRHTMRALVSSNNCSISKDKHARYY